MLSPEEGRRGRTRDLVHVTHSAGAILGGHIVHRTSTVVSRLFPNSATFTLSDADSFGPASKARRGQRGSSARHATNGSRTGSSAGITPVMFAQAASRENGENPVKWLRKGLVITALVITATSAALIASSAAMPAQAASRDGTDPHSTGCDVNAVTKDFEWIRIPQGGIIGKAELRYSPKCRTAWVRVTSNYNCAHPSAVNSGCASGNVRRYGSFPRFESCTAKQYSTRCWTKQVWVAPGVAVAGKGSVYFYGNNNASLYHLF